jgi:hypothetical protein
VARSHLYVLTEPAIFPCSAPPSRPIQTTHSRRGHLFCPTAALFSASSTFSYFFHLSTTFRYVKIIYIVRNRYCM